MENLSESFSLAVEIGGQGQVNKMSEVWLQMHLFHHCMSNKININRFAPINSQGFMVQGNLCSIHLVCWILMTRQCYAECCASFGSLNKHKRRLNWGAAVGKHDHIEINKTENRSTYRTLAKGLWILFIFSINQLFFCSFFFSFYGHTSGMWKFPS